MKVKGYGNDVKNVKFYELISCVDSVDRDNVVMTITCELDLPEN